VYFSHALEILNYHLPSIYLCKKLLIQEDIYGYIYDVYGVHGWDKPYLDLNYHKNIIKKYSYKLLKKKESLNNNLDNNLESNQDNKVNILIISHNMRGGTDKYVNDIININNKNFKSKNKEYEYDIIKIKHSPKD
jgi:hypothetical protein